MKEIWVKADPWDKRLVTTALESGADAVVVPPEKVEEVKSLGLIKTVSDNGDLKWDKDVVSVEITSADDEDEIVKLSRDKKVVVKTTDWTIIPLENLVARTGNIMVEVDDLKDAKTALGILEKGVDGLIINNRAPSAIKEIIKICKAEQGNLELSDIKISHIHPLGMGDRVCIDTCTIMHQGEGALIGNSSRGLFLVHAESLANPYISPRPFRINAGPVHAYVKVPDGKTRYLSELNAGDEILGVSASGSIQTMIVGRVKIERRPMLLIEGEGPDGTISIICQNAETIRMVGKKGDAISVVNLKQGDRVLAFVEEGGRHFGHKIDETIIEK